MQLTQELDEMRMRMSQQASMLHSDSIEWVAETGDCSEPGILTAKRPTCATGSSRELVFVNRGGFSQATLQHEINYVVVLTKLCCTCSQHGFDAAQKGLAQPSAAPAAVVEHELTAGDEVVQQQQQQQQQGQSDATPLLPPPPSVLNAAQPAPQQRLQPDAAAVGQPPPSSLQDMLMRVSGSLMLPSSPGLDAAWWLDDSTLQYIVKLHRLDEPLVLTIDAESVTLTFDQVKLMHTECRAVTYP